MALGANHRLQDGIDAVETMTRFALAVLALASGVYTYLGVRSILDGSATAVFFAALIYSCAVSVAIYAFWTYMARFYPHITGASARTAMLGIMALGCAMIIAMASWLNAAALAGSAAVEQHLAETIEDYTGDLDQAHQNALAAQSLLPDIQRTSERFQRLSDQERESGALTGTTGAGSVVQLLGQMASQLKELEAGVSASRERVTALFDEGRTRIATMRSLVSSPGAIAPRADKFSEEAVALTGTIASLEQTSIAASVKRAAEDLSLGFIAPVASGLEADLASRQDQVMETIRTSVAAQSKVLSQAADEILAREPVAERRFVPLSAAEAVLRYASDFIPSWAGAIAIDLLPAVLVFMLAIAHGAIRRQERSLPFAERITAAELLQALEVQRAISGHDRVQREPAREVPVETMIAEPRTIEPEHQVVGEPERVYRHDEPVPAGQTITESSNITSLDLSNKTPRKGAAGMTNATMPAWAKRLLALDDGTILRHAFIALLVASGVFLAIDLREISVLNASLPDSLPTMPAGLPILPPALTEGEPDNPPSDILTDPAVLQKPIAFELKPGGILAAQGAIDPGASARFATEIEARGEYVKTVALDSPGGSVEDALAMSTLIRERKLGTSVAAGALCASSCPIVFSGGVTRDAATGAVLGVHQVFNGSTERPSPEEAMATGQTLAARISRHLDSMGIKPGLWLHALETPPDLLYYLSDAEMRDLALTTPAVATARKKK